MTNLKQLIKEFRELQDLSEDEFYYTEIASAKLPKLLDAVEILVEENEKLSEKLEEHNKFFREILFTDEGNKVVGVSRNGAIRAYNRNIYVARKLFYGDPYPEEKQALQQANEKVR